jgi:hypothetical protein
VAISRPAPHLARMSDTGATTRRDRQPAKVTIAALSVLLWSASCVRGPVERVGGNLEAGFPPDGLVGPSVYGYLTADDSVGAALRLVEVRVETLRPWQLFAVSLTSRSGEYAIPLPEAGSFRILVSGFGYVTQAATVEVGGMPVRQDFSMTRQCYDFDFLLRDFMVYGPCR